MKGHSSTLETELSDPARSSLGLESNQLFSSNQACTFPEEYLIRDSFSSDKEVLNPAMKINKTDEYNAAHKSWDNNRSMNL